MLIFLINLKTTAIPLRMAVFSSFRQDNLLIFRREDLNFSIFRQN